MSVCGAACHTTLQQSPGDGLVAVHPGCYVRLRVYRVVMPQGRRSGLQSSATDPPALPVAASIVIWHVVQCADKCPNHHSCADHHSRAACCVLHRPGQWRALQHRQRRKFTMHIITPQRNMSCSPLLVLHDCLGMYVCGSHSCETMCPSTDHAPRMASPYSEVGMAWKPGCRLPLSV